MNIKVQNNLIPGLLSLAFLDNWKLGKVSEKDHKDSSCQKSLSGKVKSVTAVILEQEGQGDFI